MRIATRRMASRWNCAGLTRLRAPDFGLRAPGQLIFRLKAEATAGQQWLPALAGRSDYFAATGTPTAIRLGAVEVLSLTARPAATNAMIALA